MDFHVSHSHVHSIKICVVVLIEKLGNKVIKDKIKQYIDYLSI